MGQHAAPDLPRQLGHVHVIQRLEEDVVVTRIKIGVPVDFLRLKHFVIIIILSRAR